VCRDCKKKGNNHGTFTTKVVRSVYILLAMRGHDILYSDWGEKILHRSVHHVDSYFHVLCTTMDNIDYANSARVIIVPCHTNANATQKVTALHTSALGAVQCWTQLRSSSQSEWSEHSFYTCSCLLYISILKAALSMTEQS